MSFWSELLPIKSYSKGIDITNDMMYLHVGIANKCLDSEGIDITQCMRYLHVSIANKCLDSEGIDITQCMRYLHVITSQYNSSRLFIDH